MSASNVILSNNDAAKWIYETNAGKDPADFVNPFVSWKMIDCRHISKEYDVVFIPATITIETDHLAFAPRREYKSISRIWYAKKYGDDWYWDITGSQWERGLFDCLKENKAPGN